MKKISRKIGNELEDFVGAISDPSKADKTEVASLKPTVGKSIKATNRAWIGDSLTFADIPAHNGIMYRFSAMANSGAFTEYMIINRTDGLKSFKIAGNIDCTFTINDTTLTVTFSLAAYWSYQLVKLNNYL